MNQIQNRIKRNDNIREYIDYTCRQHTNHIKFNAHNSLDHELAKAEICYLLLQNNKEFITECRLRKTGQMADIFVTDNETVIEIIHSETEKNFKKKIDKYPDGIKVVKIDSKLWSKDDLFMIRK